MESRGSIRLDALTQVVGQSLLSAYSAFCMNDRFDYLSSRTVLEGREVRRYDPFKDAPVEGQFDWVGLAWNLLYGVMVAAGVTPCLSRRRMPGQGMSGAMTRPRGT